MRSKIKYCNDLNRNKFLSFVTAARSFLPGPCPPAKSRKWLERQSGVREVALTSTQGKSLGSLENQEVFFLNVLFLNGLLFSMADFRQEANREMLSQVLCTLQLELLVMARTKLTKSLRKSETANTLVLSDPTGS